jgi:hypothetical protein
MGRVLAGAVPAGLGSMYTLTRHSHAGLPSSVPSALEQSSTKYDGSSEAQHLLTAELAENSPRTG